ncbi:HNH endonuclease [Gordonia sp. SL306]|uniref:HNH endonuclease n=1 Tax=Gordonia sp. SL306 TaxID=2995145 RepID=UPI002270BE37|nr:HNH endonuclease signature motif containing protein [Gordonia sp. SL306]WAC56361.1 DUF222 domain-containing protein [Gordonia sp. SL306]
MGDISSAIQFTREVTVADAVTGRQVFDATKALMELRNIVDHLLAVHAAALDRLGVARQSGGKTRTLLIEMGAAPGVAARWMRIGAALESLQRLPGYAADGVFSGEHVDAIVQGLVHIASRAADGLCDEERLEHERALIAQALSGATPKEIEKIARGLGNQVAAETGGLPAGEDRRINEFAVVPTSDGRVAVKGDLDVVIGEKLTAAIDSLTQARPEPDGSPDARSPGAQRADALEQILDAATSANTPFMTAPKTHINLTIPVGTPDLASLPWLGPVSQATAKMLACDAGITEIIIDGNRAPLDMGYEQRLFTSHQRKAIIARDQCCIKCGAPASWAHVHHMVHWQDGGPTDLDNGCLLCPSCHAQVHAHGWDITLGIDRHPWLIPPSTIDPHRKPLPAHNRRTMHLDNIAA